MNRIVLNLVFTGLLGLFPWTTDCLAQDASWSADSNTGFSLQIDGQGELDGGGTYISPSGLWDVNASFSTSLSPGSSNVQVWVPGAAVTYLPSRSAGYTNGLVTALFGPYTEYYSSGGGFSGNVGDYFLSTFPSDWTVQGEVALLPPWPTGDWSIYVFGSGSELAIPEPSSLLLLSLGLTVLALLHRRRH